MASERRTDLEPPITLTAQQIATLAQDRRDVVVYARPITAESVDEAILLATPRQSYTPKPRLTARTGSSTAARGSSRSRAQRPRLATGSSCVGVSVPSESSVLCRVRTEHDVA